MMICKPLSRSWRLEWQRRRRRFCSNGNGASISPYSDQNLSRRIMSNSLNGRLIKLAMVASAYGVARLAIAASRRYDFRNRLIVITGGSRGLGLVLARHLADEGAALVLCARDAEELAVASAEVCERGPFVATYVCDLSDRAEIE